MAVDLLKLKEQAERKFTYEVKIGDEVVDTLEYPISAHMNDVKNRILSSAIKTADFSDEATAQQELVGAYMANTLGLVDFDTKYELVKAMDKDINSRLLKILKKEFKGESKETIEMMRDALIEDIYSNLNAYLNEDLLNQDNTPSGK